MRHVLVVLAALALTSGCSEGMTPAATPRESNAAVGESLARGLDQIRTTRDMRKLQVELVRTVATLRSEHGSTVAGRIGRALAIDGFDATLAGVRARIDFDENDSGNVEAATRDARRASRFLKRGAEYLRRAGQALGVPVGKLNGY